MNIIRRAACIFLLSSCAIQAAIEQSFYADDDPQLVAEAMPILLKMSEALMILEPHSFKHYWSAGTQFTVYANAFVQVPAEQLDDFEQRTKELQRAKKLYLRSREYLAQGLALYKPIWQDVLNAELSEKHLDAVDDQSYDALYWFALSWLGSLVVDPLDFELLGRIHTPLQILYKLLQFDDKREDIHAIWVSLYTSLPSSFLEQALNLISLKEFAENYYNSYKTLDERTAFHFQQAQAFATKGSPQALLSMAKAQMKKQDREQFSLFLQKLLDLKADGKNSIILEVYKQQAQWLLDHVDDFFL